MLHFKYLKVYVEHFENTRIISMVQGSRVHNYNFRMLYMADYVEQLARAAPRSSRNRSLGHAFQSPGGWGTLRQPSWGVLRLKHVVKFDRRSLLTVDGAQALITVMVYSFAVGRPLAKNCYVHGGRS